MFKFYQKKELATGLNAIIAIHHPNRGPALGGCRLANYGYEWQAYREAARLARAMTYKSAIHDLPFTGGKTVLIAPEQLASRATYFQSLGKFINELQGNYIAAVDSGVSEEDMNEVAKNTSFVTNHSHIGGDPSPYTAKGVSLAIKTAIKFLYKQTDLENLHIVIQGVGHVGYALVKELYDSKIRITISDTNPAAIQYCRANFAINVVSPEEVFNIDCDIFAPCAMGGVINQNTVPRLRTKIIAGAANNPLTNANIGYQLQQRNILYLPDYVINAGGLICCARQYLGKSTAWVEEKIQNIAPLLTLILQEAEATQLPTNIIADKIAKRRFTQANNLHLGL